jgi:hypothetical protein
MSFFYYDYAHVKIELEVQDSAGNKTRQFVLVLKDGDGRKALADAFMAIVRLVGTTSTGYATDGSSYTERLPVQPSEGRK